MNRTSFLARMLGVLALFGGSPSGAAEDHCGGVKLEAGQVRLGKPLSEQWVKSPEGKACLGELVKEVDKFRLVRGVTVAAISSDADRANGSGLAGAKVIAAALVEAGLPRGRVFALAPAAQRNDLPGISLRYVERAPEDVVARVAASGGAVFLGADEASLKPAEPGMPVLVNELIKTGPNAKALIHLKDGSGIEVKAESMIKMAVLQISGGGDRQVKIEVLHGSIVADVRKAVQGSRFEASSKVSVASVRGTQFQFGVDDEGATRLETFEGVVGVTPSADANAKPIEVPAGQGVLVSKEGKASAPRPLPEAPRVTRPQKGPLGAEARFEWQAVEGVESYRIDVARDADFLVEPRSQIVSATTVSWPEPLPKGKWFWQVTGVNADGFAGPPSKVYAFTVGN